MRLVVFSPMAVASAIGRVTVSVVRELRGTGHEVLIVRSEDRGTLRRPIHEVATDVLPWTDRRAVRAAALDADAVIYQIGNHYGYHRGCLEWLPRFPGIVCLHDYFLGSLFRDWARGRRTQAEQVVSGWYGRDVAERYLAIDERSFIDETHAHAPMTEWVASMASAVVTHSSWGIWRVLSACPGPVSVLPLPYGIRSRGDGRLADGPRIPGAFTILTVGHINANKRVPSVIRAIAESRRLRAVTTYRLIGRIEPAMAAELTAMAEESGVSLEIAGEVSDEALRTALAEADVVCNLRLPALEAASASAIEAMLHGKVVVVLDTGFYRELPDEVVRKVSPEREIAQLRAVLEALWADPAARAAVGTTAAEWAARTFRADAYAEGLVRVAAQVQASAPLLDASRWFAQVLSAWGASDRMVTKELVQPLRFFERVT